MILAAPATRTNIIDLIRARPNIGDHDLLSVILGNLPVDTYRSARISAAAFPIIFGNTHIPSRCIVLLPCSPFKQMIIDRWRSFKKDESPMPRTIFVNAFCDYILGSGFDDRSRELETEQTIKECFYAQRKIFLYISNTGDHVHGDVE